MSCIAVVYSDMQYMCVACAVLTGDCWFAFSFWATVCKTVRIMLSDRCLSVLSVTLMYCGQTARWIKMKRGMEVGPSHIV